MSSKARKELKIGGGTSPHRQLFTPSTPVRTSHTTQGRAKDGEKTFQLEYSKHSSKLAEFFLENLKRLAGLERAKENTLMMMQPMSRFAGQCDICSELAFKHWLRYSNA